MKKKTVIIIGILIITIIAISFALSSKKSKTKNAIPTVQTENVKTQKMITTVEADGTVVFRDKISVYTKNAGKVNRLPIKEGDTINKNDVIVQYDKTALNNLQRQLDDANLSLKSANLALEGLMLPTDESQLKQLEAQISQTEKSIIDIENNLVQLDKDIAKAQTDLDGANILYSQGAISQTEFNNFENALTNLKNQKTSAENSLEVSKKQLEANNAQYKTAKDKLSDPSIKNRIDSQKVVVEQAKLRVNQLTKDIKDFEIASKSPITGTLVKLFVSEGEAVPEGKLVAEVGDLKDLVVEAYIPEYDMDGVAVGQQVLIKSDATDEEITGQITKVYPLAEIKNIGGSEKSVVKVEVAMPMGSSLKAGYTTDLVITTKIEDNALVIPIVAYMTEKVDDKNSAYVFVVNDDNTLEKRTIKVKSIKNSVVSVEGLSEGEKIVVSPTEAMKDGIKIIPVDSTQEAEQKANPAN